VLGNFSLVWFHNKILHMLFVGCMSSTGNNSVNKANGMPYDERMEKVEK